MKNHFKLFMLSFFTFLCVQSNAQIGIRAGVNLSTFSVSEGEEELGLGSKAGFGIGLFYKANVTDRLSIQPELNFIQQGSKFELDFVGITTTSKLNLNYLQVPVLVKYAFGNLEKTNFYVQGGPYVGFGIGKPTTKTCLDGECETEDGEYDSNGEEGPKPLDFGLQLGVGVNINQNITLDARYLIGLNNLNGDSEGTIKNRGINLSVGYSF